MLAQAELNSLELKVDGGATHRFVLLLICEDDKLPPVLPNARGGQLSLSGTQSRIFFIWHRRQLFLPANDIPRERRVRSVVCSRKSAGGIHDFCKPPEATAQGAVVPPPTPPPCRRQKGLQLQVLLLLLQRMLLRQR